MLVKGDVDAQAGAPLEGWQLRLPKTHFRASESLAGWASSAGGLSGHAHISLLGVSQGPGFCLSEKVGAVRSYKGCPPVHLSGNALQRPSCNDAYLTRGLLGSLGAMGC